MSSKLLIPRDYFETDIKNKILNLILETTCIPDKTIKIFLKFFTYSKGKKL